MHRNLVRVFVASALFLAILVVPTPPAEATSRCPSMTDSIERLYRAYLQRPADPAGLDEWVGRYQRGEMGLAEISEAFAGSPEFSTRGLITDQDFVTWVYRNLAGREPTTDELNHWLRSLGGGYPRGSMMLSFTESSDYVAATGTAVPLAGYRRWYPQGTHWYCAIGSTNLGIIELRGEVWADFLYRNRSTGTDDAGIWTVQSDGQRITLNTRRLQPTERYYNWDGVFSGDGKYGDAIEVKAGRSTEWVVVFYPHSIGTERLGWQLS